MAEKRQSTIEHDAKHLAELLDRERRAGREEVVRDESSRDGPAVDLSTLLAEMTALKAAVRAETTASRELREAAVNAVEALRGELNRAHLRERATQSRAERESASIGKRAVADLIEIADRLEIALAGARRRQRSRWGRIVIFRDRAVESIIEGLELTLRRLRQNLSERGVRRVEAKGEPFDAETMEVVERVSRTDVDDGVVVEEVTAGYVSERGEPAIRTAQVVVNRRARELG